MWVYSSFEWSWFETPFVKMLTLNRSLQELSHGLLCFSAIQKVVHSTVSTCLSNREIFGMENVSPQVVFIYLQPFNFFKVTFLIKNDGYETQTFMVD